MYFVQFQEMIENKEIFIEKNHLKTALSTTFECMSVSLGENNQFDSNVKIYNI